MISKDMRTALSRADDSVFLAAVGSRTMDVAKDFVSQYTKKSNQQPVAFGSYKEAIEYAGAKAVYIGLVRDGQIIRFVFCFVLFFFLNSLFFQAHFDERGDCDAVHCRRKARAGRQAVFECRVR